MPTPRRNLLAAYLPTPGGEDALGLGIAMARSLNADLTVCMVLPPADRAKTPEARSLTESLDDQAADWLASATADVPDDVVAEGHLAFHENAAEGLVLEAQQTHSDVIVVGGSGGGIIGRHSLGSVVNDLLHVSSTPVVIAPLGARESAEPIRRITCAIGRRGGTGALLETAVATCRHTGFPLRLISFVTADGRLPGDTRHRGRRPARAEAAEHLRELADDVRGRLESGHEISTEIIAAESVEAGVGLVEWAAGDIVYVGSSRLARPLHLFLGSTASKMLRALAVPMVVVPKDADVEES
nr:universal stress protein [Gordonia sp. NB41Y]EMP12283.2 universal stress protein UspA [Gordonia sp. NB41Y]